MKLNLKKVGNLTHMEAEGTPKEISDFVALLGLPESDSTMMGIPTIKIGSQQDPNLIARCITAVASKP